MSNPNCPRKIELLCGLLWCWPAGVFPLLHCFLKLLIRGNSSSPQVLQYQTVSLFFGYSKTRIVLKKCLPMANMLHSVKIHWLEMSKLEMTEIEMSNLPRGGEAVLRWRWPSEFCGIGISLAVQSFHEERYNDDDLWSCGIGLQMSTMECPPSAIFGFLK